MASQVGIVNIALTSLGADRITAMSDNNENARRMTAIYDSVLADVLRVHPWNFAIVRVALSQLTTTPAFGYDYEYQLPTACLRLIEVSDGTNVLTDYKVEGRKLLTDYTTIYIKYIATVSDPNQYTSQFIFLLAARLASELAYAITNNKTTAELATQIYEKKLQTAKETDAQESDSTNVIDADSWTIDKRI